MTNLVVLTPEQAAEALSLSPSTLAKLRLSGNGPAYCKMGRRKIGYRPADLELWVEYRAIRSGAGERHVFCLIG